MSSNITYLWYELIDLILCILYFYRYAVNPIKSDESLPQGAANTDLDNESSIGDESGIGDDSAVGSEAEDIDDTPTSVRRVCFPLEYINISRNGLCLISKENQHVSFHGILG